MDTREVAAEYRLTKWAQMIQSRAQSGQSTQKIGRMFSMRPKTPNAIYLISNGEL